MAKFTVRYQTINPGTKKVTGTCGSLIDASNASEARQKFKSNHVDNINTKYKILSVLKHG